MGRLFEFKVIDTLLKLASKYQSSYFITKSQVSSHSILYMGNDWATGYMIRIQKIIISFRDEAVDPQYISDCSLLQL